MVAYVAAMLGVEPRSAIDKWMPFRAEMARLVLAARSTRAPVVPTGLRRWPVAGVARDLQEEIEGLVTTRYIVCTVLAVDAGAAKQCDRTRRVTGVGNKPGQPDQRERMFLTGGNRRSERSQRAVRVAAKIECAPFQPAHTRPIVGWQFIDDRSGEGSETGGIGLFLFLFSVLVLLGSGWRALTRVRDPWERTLLIACGAALVGGLIEVAGSPAFQFCGVWAVFWSVAGVFVAVIRLAGAEPEPGRERRGYVVAAVIAAVLCGGALWLGKRLWDPRGQPRGVFKLLEQTHGPYAPGETVRWRATYRNGWGKEQGSASATTWLTPIWYAQGRVAAPRLIQSQAWALMREPFNHSDPLRGFSEFSLRLPGGETGMVQVQAVFQDEFGRTYSGSRVADVVKPLPGVKKPSPKSLSH